VTDFFQMQSGVTVLLCNASCRFECVLIINLDVILIYNTLYIYTVEAKGFPGSFHQERGTMYVL